MKKFISFPAKVLKPIKDYLVSKQKKLERRKKDLKTEDPFADETRVNNNAASDADAYEISGHDRVEALENEVDRRLIIIRKTLTKMKLGKYGLCENCRKLIDTDRLAVNPTAELCMKCFKEKQK